MLIQKEELKRIATPIGNGSHIIVPKEWGGYEIILTKKVGIEPKREILEILRNYLKNIIGIYIYGSYARKEQTKDSDIDVIVITNKKINFVEFKKPFDVIFIEKSEIDAFKKLNPVLFYSFLFEADSILNENFIDELKNENFKNFKHNIGGYINDSFKILKINKQILELNKLRENNFVDASIVYSLILRLRGICIIKSLIKKEKFSNKSFFMMLRDNNFSEPEYYYNLYRLIRDNKKSKRDIKIEEAEDLINLLDNQLKEIKGIIHAK